MKELKISGKTRVCGLIGDPVEHSMSPTMHNAAFAELGLDYVYAAFRVRGDDLRQAIEGMRALNLRGFNVTIPHKVAVMPLLDELDPLAEKIGAVNTVVNNGGKLKGYNTDATGFLQALREKGIEPAGKNVAILGAGGASRAISFILVDEGAHLTILNRAEELDWAVQLAQRLEQEFGRKVWALELSEQNLAKALEKADVLVNATPVGMSPKDEETPVSTDLLKPDLLVYDIVYNPVRTRLLREAEAANARTIAGLDMLVWQGAMAFELWTGQKPPFKLMRQEAARLLEQH